MLPDDMENLAQSVIASNTFTNNILAILTTKNYWDVVNEFKPLMHTWSLGIEFSFYLIFPLLFIVPDKGPNHFKVKLLLILMTLGSLLAYVLYPASQYQKFYFFPYRFWEFGAGALAAIFFIGDST